MFFCDCTSRYLTNMSRSPTCRERVAINWEKAQFLINTLYLISFACVISHMALTPSTIMCQLFFLLNSLVFHRKIRGVSQKYCDPPPPFLPLLLLILVDCRQSSVLFRIFLLQTRHRDRKKNCFISEYVIYFRNLKKTSTLINTK